MADKTKTRPNAGGSYTRDPKTGELTPNKRRIKRSKPSNKAEDKPEKPVEKADGSSKTPTGGTPGN